MPILEGFRPPWNGQMPKMRLLLSKTKIGFRRMPYRKVVKRKAFRNPERLFLYLVVMKFYFLLRYAAKANANAPKIAATVVGSGTFIEISRLLSLIA